MKKGEEVEVEITDLAFGGDGVGRVGGTVVFVPFTAVGDRVRVQLTRADKRFWRGEIRAMLRPGLGRVKPVCPYYGLCGGCQYQHLAYEVELAAKEKQVRDVLERIGGVKAPPVRPICPSPVVYGYRNRITVHRGGGRLGFRGVDGRTVVDIEGCALASDGVNERLARLRRTGLNRDHYSVREPGLEMDVFYQVNGLMAERLVSEVLAAVRSGITGAVDAYCGTGFFTRRLCERVGTVVGIEANQRAVELARRSLPENGRVLQGEVETLLGEARELLTSGPSLLLLDPPREGLSARVRELASALVWDQLIYVSCNPSTLARDVRDLAPVWQLREVTPLDLFPRTAHFECVAVLDRG